jgi:hypothetical protein
MEEINEQSLPKVDRLNELTAEFELLHKQYFDLVARYRQLKYYFEAITSGFLSTEGDSGPF